MKRFRQKGYYNDPEDIEFLAGKSADEIVTYQKEGHGAFHASTDAEFRIGKNQRLAPYQMLTKDGRYLVITDVPDKEDYLDETSDGSDSVDCDLFIDIYELNESKDEKGTPATFKLSVIYGEQAATYSGDHGFEKAVKKIKRGKLDGSIESYEFDTERDRDTAARILADADGWLGMDWKKN